MATVNITTPVGRLVQGSLTKPNEKDAEGRPLVFKNGPNAGQPRVDWFIAIAIAKGAEAAHGPYGWMATEWGAKIRQVGESFLAHAAQLPGFAWKVTDGDSQVPNKNGRKPCDQEGHPGHWVLKFSGGYAPKCYTLTGGATQPQAADGTAINPGDFVQVNFDVEPNGSASQPGVYLNHRMVCLLAYGQRITTGPDVAAAGFGAGAALPAGAMPTPPAGFTTAAVPPLPGAPAIPGAALPPPVVPAVPPVAALPPPVAPVPPTPAAVPAIPIVPNPAFLQVPGTPVPPQAPARRMLPPANGASYEQLIAAGWTDATLVQNGLMAA